MGAPALTFVDDRLAHGTCPTSVVVLDALARNPTGKIIERELRSS
ncbi:hypothetical protein JCM18899A_04580 [Nocardioides sp. AN3]